MIHADSLIMDFESALPFVKLFIALAAPWGGEKLDSRPQAEVEMH